MGAVKWQDDSASEWLSRKMRHIIRFMTTQPEVCCVVICIGK